jgi:hypothetical protein
MVYIALVFVNVSLMSYLGWNDGTTGPLIPVMQEYYHVCSNNINYRYIVNQ